MLSHYIEYQSGTVLQYPAIRYYRHGELHRIDKAAVIWFNYGRVRFMGKMRYRYGVKCR